jgi:hypothetical protein
MKLTLPPLPPMARRQDGAGGRAALERRRRARHEHHLHGPGPPSGLRGLSVLHSESGLHGGFVWARTWRLTETRRLPARAVADRAAARAPGLWPHPLPPRCPGPPSSPPALYLHHVVVGAVNPRPGLSRRRDRRRQQKLLGRLGRRWAAT